jgi:hypothetical protein
MNNIEKFVIGIVFLILLYIGWLFYVNIDKDIEIENFKERQLNEFVCNKTEFQIKEIKFTSGKYNYPYYVLEYDNKIYFYKIDSIPKKIPDTINLYNLSFDKNWIIDQSKLIKKCEK